MSKQDIKTYDSLQEKLTNLTLVKSLLDTPIPNNQLLANLGLYLTSKNLSRILFMNFLYQQIVDTQGIVIDFGTRWGNNMALFSALRGIYEPFNRHRKIVGFDTFNGFPSITKQDGSSDMMKEGQLAVTEGYPEYLDSILMLQEKLNPLAHIKKYEIVAGDVKQTLPEYLDGHPETIIALAYFDFDLYEPTFACLKAIQSHLVKGSVLGFDELNDVDSPGETKALNETIGLKNIGLKRYRYASRNSYFVME